MKKLILSVLSALALCTASAQTDYNALTLNHQLANGMTYGNVLTALGNPRHTTTSCYSPSGVLMECWTAMENGRGAYGISAVCFENGRVVSFNQLDSSAR